MPWFKIIIISLLFILFAACQSLERHDYIKPLPPPRTKAADIIIGYSTPNEKIVILSDVTIQYNSGYSRDEIMKRLQQMAADSGGDGIKLIKLTTGASEYSIQGGMPGARLDGQNFRLQVQFYRFSDQPP